MPTVKRKPRTPTELVRAILGPLAAWGRHPFAPPDEADGASVDSKAGRVKLIRGPDGRLYASAVPPEAER